MTKYFDEVKKKGGEGMLLCLPDKSIQSYKAGSETDDAYG